MAQIGEDLLEARRILEANGVVAVPTETVYGLATNALSEVAVTEVFRIKNRPHFDPLIVHLADIDDIHHYAEKPAAILLDLLTKYAPGPLTVLLPRKSIIPDLVTSGLPEVGIRIPEHPLLRALLRQLPFPLAAPSANPFGYISPTTAAHVQQQLGEQIEYILDGGPCAVGIESTVVRWDGTNLHILRAGGVTREQLKAFDVPIIQRQSSTSNPVAPGMLDKHYAPRTPLTLAPLADITDQVPLDRIGVLAWRQKLPSVPPEHQYVLSPSGDLQEAARHLFSFLRKLDEAPVDIIHCELVPSEGLGRAINDKLRRASL